MRRKESDASTNQGVEGGDEAGGEMTSWEARNLPDRM